jgi:CRP-like cAMP-binding protein
MERLKNEITGKDLAMDSLKKEMDQQKRLREQLIEQNAKKIIETQEALEQRHADAIEDHLRTQERVAAELAEMSLRRTEAESKVERLERELKNIRAHMLGVLQADPKVGPGESKNQEGVLHSFDTRTIQSLSKKETATVDDYLKRLGY